MDWYFYCTRGGFCRFLVSKSDWIPHWLGGSLFPGFEYHLLDQSLRRAFCLKKDPVSWEGRFLWLLLWNPPSSFHAFVFYEIVSHTGQGFYVSQESQLDIETHYLTPKKSSGTLPHTHWFDFWTNGRPFSSSLLLSSLSVFAINLFSISTYKRLDRLVSALTGNVI